MIQRRGALTALTALLLSQTARGDVYLHNPRGSNNKLSEQNNNVQNAQRLFDSQNNGNGGYQIGDRCEPVCQDENRDYDETKPGAMMGQMTYYAGSELYVEWALQHSCGHDNNNVICQVILQYMCEKDNPVLRDGVQRGNQNNAGGQQEPPVEAESEEKDGQGRFLRGQHEPLDFYLDCRKRQRNKGLYTADRNMNEQRGATATRQNPNGNANANDRNGLECPEERDYYPYWHPTPWHDIAIITDEPAERCIYYQAESQNVKPKNYCSSPEYNNERDCTGNGGSWLEKPSFEEEPPQCMTGVRQRDNHNGNSEGTHPQYFMWKIPEGLEGRCVLRLRYNMTSGDFRPGSTASGGGSIRPSASESDEQRRLHGTLRGDRLDQLEPRALSAQVSASVFPKRQTGGDYFFVDSTQNDPDPGRRRRSLFEGGPPVLIQDPIADFVDLGDDYLLQMNVNTNQYGRTFQDRTHSFYVKQRPVNVPNGARIVNYNVRGRRGNIVQVYPAVEYDFVPNDLTVEEGDFLHFQWAGSDANPKGNDGNGRQGTDRSNLVQTSSREENIPMSKESHTLFFDAATDPNNEEGLANLRKMAYLNQNDIVNCNQNPDPNQDQATDDCQQLNGASSYFDGGVVEMKQVGEHKVMSTRNNDFSNRSQKATIRVTAKVWKWWMISLAIAGAAFGVVLVIYLGAAAYAFYNPRSWLGARKFRPRVLKLVAKPETLRQMDIQHKEHREKLWQESQQATVISGQEIVKPVAAAASGRRGSDTLSKNSPAPSDGLTKPWGKECASQCLASVGLGERQLLGVIAYILLNLAVFFWGFITEGSQRRTWGVERSNSWALAVGAGYALSLNLAVGILPSLKSLHTALQGCGGPLRDWIPVDDPFTLLAKIATITFAWTLVHVIGHFSFMGQVSLGVPMQPDVLHVLRLPEEQAMSGSSVLNQALAWRSLTGLAALVFLLLMLVTTLPRCASLPFCRMFGGYQLYQRAHSLWPLFYLLMLLHGTPRLYVWLFFPVVCYFVDRSLLTQRQTHDAVLFSARALPSDVLHLALEVPEGFSYQAGQYVLLNWRGEWHPFTLTSSPEEPLLSLHIRCSTADVQHDWCSALSKRVLLEAPAAAGCTTAARLSVQPVPGTSVEYERSLQPVGVVSVPRGNMPGCKDESERAGARQVEDPTILQKVSRKDVGDTVLLQIAGPFGALSSRIWEFDTVMLVGVGFGATPLVSILRSVQLRTQQRTEILGAAGAKLGKDSKLGRTSDLGDETELRRRREAARSMQGGQAENSSSGPLVMGKGVMGGAKNNSAWNSGMGVADLIRQSVRVPSKIHIYWLVSNSAELQWLFDQLAAAIEGPAKDMMDITIFVRPEVDKSTLATLPCQQRVHVGRPRWGQVYKSMKVQHPGCSIGVLLCGSSSASAKLLKQARKRSDPPDAGTVGTTFSYFKESF